MASSARKRPRPESEDNRAECPFSIKIVDPKEKKHKDKKRRRTEGGGGDDDDTKFHVQLSPFAPSGKFKSHETMDLHYQVDPSKKWTEMTRYNSFVLNGVKYFSEGFIYVANDSSIERQKQVAHSEPMRPRKKSDDDWVARILEIRAADEHHVYARVYWMYWPDELPQGTHDGKKIVQGRQPYHGANELIASNHMDIINVVSVTSQATVRQWYEENEEEIQNALYWRQAFDVRTYELSTVELVCSCNTPAHPDKLLVGCTTETCKKWMHEQCIKDDALRATYNRLGTDKPHRSPESTVKKDEDKEEAKRPLSPTEGGTGASTQQSIDVKAVDSSDADAVQDNVEVKPSDDEDAKAPADTPPEPSSETQPQGDKTEPSTPAPGTPGGSKATSGRKQVGRRKTKVEANGDSNARPWEGLFEVSLKMDAGPPMLEFKDLREGVGGGDKTWTERVKCLVCGSEVN
ncbi:hypothetical protein QBC46DRAFT_99875 [Diplogelasinospora grovesii]|uniref:BAH domain-containing protein n=1 Tax=Diplogelasinospora grovesii TaxID=303347 RepID=A0AAN6S5S0_9PEZI|nr:hypothetical protein QBC46DRAFT_99875 [Diplogelasinospora grovesii]